MIAKGHRNSIFLEKAGVLGREANAADQQLLRLQAPDRARRAFRRIQTARLATAR